MNVGDRVVWHSFKRDDEGSFILHDAVIVSVDERWHTVVIECLERDGMFTQNILRKVTGDRLSVRYHAVPELDGE